jgi:hypothetical protein
VGLSKTRVPKWQRKALFVTPATRIGNYGPIEILFYVPDVNDAVGSFTARFPIYPPSSMAIANVAVAPVCHYYRLPAHLV